MRKTYTWHPALMVLRKSPWVLPGDRPGRCATGCGRGVIATGVIDDKPGRHGEVGAWRLDHGKLVRGSPRTDGKARVPTQPRRVAPGMTSV